MRKFAKRCLAGVAAAALFAVSATLAPQAFAQQGPPDYTSAVPQFTYPESLEEQEAALKTNPLLERFAESRRERAADRYWPLYHFYSPEGGLNDPNGLCFWQGRWHLFYQSYPPDEPQRQHWGHAVSDDLVRWRDLPYAIYPDPENKSYSGSALVEDDRVIVMYHGVGQGTMVAVSDDPLLLNWEKLTGGPVIARRLGHETPRIYDPCIWKHDGTYYALTGHKEPKGPGGKPIREVYLHRSDDLVTWEYLHPFLEDDLFGLVGDDASCPYFWPLGDRHILLTFSHVSGGKYLLGDYDTERHKFVVTAGGDFTFGPFRPGGVHAPSAVPDGEGGVIVIFNMNPSRTTEDFNAKIMTLPRRLTLVGKEDVRVEPAGDIESLRGRHQRLENMPLTANEEIVLENIEGNAMEIIAEIDIRNGAPMIEMNVLRSPQREEFTRIAFFGNRGYGDGAGHGLGRQSLISIDSSYASTYPNFVSRGPETAPVYMAGESTLKLRVFIDRSVVEVFVNDRQCVAVRVFPEREDSLGISFRSQGRTSTLKSLDAWQMKSIYKTADDDGAN